MKDKLMIRIILSIFCPTIQMAFWLKLWLEKAWKKCDEKRRFFTFHIHFQSFFSWFLVVFDERIHQSSKSFTKRPKSCSSESDKKVKLFRFLWANSLSMLIFVVNQQSNSKKSVHLCIWLLFINLINFFRFFGIVTTQKRGWNFWCHSFFSR